MTMLRRRRGMRRISIENKQSQGGDRWLFLDHQHGNSDVDDDDLDDDDLDHDAEEEEEY